LLATIGVQCLGVAAWTHVGETPLFELLVFDWEWPEETGSLIERVAVLKLLALGVLLFLFGLLALFTHWPRTPGWLVVLTALSLASIASWQLVLTLCQWFRGEGFRPMLSWGALEDRLLGYFVFGEEAVRWGAPLALILWLPWPGRQQISWRRVGTVLWLLRLAAAGTFSVHGYEAIRTNARFIDLIIAAGYRLLDQQVSEPTAGRILLVIGIIDIALALLLVTRRWRWVAFYMAAWGFITATSRVILLGPGGYPEMLLRAANGGVPLAIGLAWLYLPPKSFTPDSTMEPIHAPPSV